MTSPRTYIILTVSTLAAVLVAGWALWSETSAAARPERGGGPLFPALAQAGAMIDSIEIDAQGYDLSLLREGDGWFAVSQGGYPVRMEPVTDLVSDIAGMQVLEQKTSNPDWYRWIAVEDPESPSANSARVEVSGADGQLAEVIVGKVSASMGSDIIGGTFVRRPDDAQALLVSGITEIPRDFAAWFEQLFSIEGPSMRRIAISEGDTILFDARKPEGQQTYALVSVAPELAAEGEIIDEALLRRMAQSMVSVTFEAVGTADAVQVAPDARRVTFETEDGLVLTAQVTQQGDQPWLVFSAKAGSESPAQELAQSIRQKTEGWAFRLPASKMLPLLTDVKDLLMVEAPTDPAQGPGQIIDPSVFGLPQGRN